jgi:hypothetical protein
MVLLYAFLAGAIVYMLFGRVIRQLLTLAFLCLGTLVAFAGAKLANEALADPYTLQAYAVGALVGFVVVVFGGIAVRITNILITIDERSAIAKIKKQAEERRSLNV